MKNGLKQEEWIERVLKSTDAVVSAESNPYLYRKVLLRLQRAPQTVSSPAVWATAAALALLVLINVAAIRQTASKMKANDASILVQDYQLSEEPWLAR